MIRRVGILGAGALGSLFAYALTRHTAAAVWLFARSPMPGHVEVVGEGRIPVQVTDAPSVPVDLLIVLVKAQATADAVRWAEGAIGPHTIALTVQNGLGNGEALAERLGPERVLAGATTQGATLVAPGVVIRPGTGKSQFAPWAPGGIAQQRAADVAALLNQAGLTAEVTDDPQPLIWSKLVVNCGINALTAILRVPNGELLERPSARRLMEAAAREAGAVAAAQGVCLTEEPVAKTLAVAAATAPNRSSMLQDLERGRRTEVGAINGGVTERGRVLGVPTPVNALLTDLVHALEV